jgi:SAM-dependent methyltransferase
MKNEIISQYINRSKDYTWKIYQPIPLPGYEITYKYSGRKCIDRLEFINNTIKNKFKNKSIKILDIGCNGGYFVFELSKMGHDVTGLDMDEKIINRNNFLLSEYSNFAIKPKFKKEKITIENLVNLNLDKYDLVIGLSVFHHINNKFEFLMKFSKLSKYAYIEMDGPEYGEIYLKTFYNKVNYMGSAKDPYGNTFKKRKIFECDNTTSQSLKNVNLIWGRNVFLENNIVIKRQTKKPTHTWLETDLRHEVEIYKKYEYSNFFPKLYQYKISDTHHEIHIEYIENKGSPTIEEIYRLYDFLQKENLFIVDFVRDMFFFDKKNKIKLVDVESLMDKKSYEKKLKNPNKKIHYDTYEKQIDFLKKLYKI